jgi:HD-GYP domain-containing protein (c-di-GMP phosphodiesterase class II)/c-di-GMP-binding flagellar brake protein YcgR
MSNDGELYARIDHPTEINQLLELLCQPGGASLRLEGSTHAPLPVLVETPSADTTLRLDVSAIRDRPEVRAVGAGEGFRIFGRDGNGMARTPVLTVQRVREEGDRLYLECAFPDYLEKLQRRDSFRAKLRRGMAARVDLYDGGATASGQLRDLSLRGCLVELEANAIALLDDRRRPLHLELSFPDGSRFKTDAWPRHQTSENGHILCGFSFEVDSHNQEQQMWRLVRETEREAARSATSERAGLRPSPLFIGDALDTPPTGPDATYQTPFARRLARSAAFLATQIVRLRQGATIESSLLSQHAEALLALQREDREGLLFALACLHQELPLIRHCLAVAVRLVDLGAALGLKQPVLKALAAAGMVHDLGKALVPAALREATALDAAQRVQMHAHVGLVRQRLVDCTWLAPVAIETVIDGANERLDGSGYPEGRGADKLHELMRLAAVVDVADAMGRDRPDRPRHAIEAIHAYLREHADQFDARWVQRYVDHFGTWPVGTLLKFQSGALGWVLSLTDARALASVRVVAEPTPADTTGGALVRGEELARLGQPLGELTPAP